MARWLTTTEFLKASSISLRHFRRNTRRFITRKEGNRLLISSDSLPVAAQPSVDSLSAPGKETKHSLGMARVPVPLFASTAAQGPGRRILLSREQERQASERLQILQPLLDFCSGPEARVRFSALRLSDGSPVRVADDMARYLAETHSTPERKITRSTLWLWKKNFEQRGAEGLVRKVRADKGSAKWAMQFPEAAKLVAATFLQASSTRQRAYDELVRNAARLGMAGCLPSYASVCAFIATLPAAAVVLAREGESAHNERMAPYLSRGYTDIGANDVWVADTMIHDVLVRNDCFGTGSNEPVRLQLTALMDLRTRKLVGYTWCLDGSSRSITTALVRAVRAYGPCRTFYCDNGKDFQKVGRFAQPANRNVQFDEDVQAIERTGALRQLGMMVQFCIKYHPQSKPIERFFRTLHLGLDAHFRHYTTGNAYTKPDATVEAAAKHGKLLRMGRPDISPLMPASHFIRMAETWIEQDYNAKHRVKGRGMNGMTPNEVFEQGYPIEVRRPFDASILDTLLWRRERRKVRECAVTVDGRRMIGASAFAAEVLYRANETEVIVCFDPNAPAEGVITDLDGHKLADVRAERLVPQSAEAGPMIAESMEQRRGLRNNTAASIRRLRKDVMLAGHKTDVEDLYERAMLPMAVNDSITQRVAPMAESLPIRKLHSEDIGDAFAAQLRGGRCGA